MPVLEPCQRAQMHRRDETQAAREHRIRDRQAWYKTPEGKQAIARGALKHLRYHVPREMMIQLKAENKDVMQHMRDKNIYVDPEEYQEWHQPKDFTPDRNDIFNALKESVCADGKHRFTWRWDPQNGNYPEGGKRWQYMLTDMQVAPEKCHRSYRIINEWLDTPEDQRPDFEDVNFQYGPTELDFAPRQRAR